MKYLEDTYKKQLKGPIKLYKGDYISICNTYDCKYGIISYCKNKSVYYYKCNEVYVDGKFVPDFRDFKYNIWGPPDNILYCVSIWKCKKIGYDTPENNKARIINLNRRLGSS